MSDSKSQSYLPLLLRTVISIFVFFLTFLSFTNSVTAKVIEGGGGGGGGGGWTCFPAGTKVLMSGGSQKNIEDVKIGDKVVSQSEKGQKSISSVTALDTPIRNHMCSIGFSDGQKLELTNEHPMFTLTGWKSIDPDETYYENPNLNVDKLAVGDEIANSKGGFNKVSSIFCRLEKVQTYNLILEKGDHTYFANGFLAHNKIVDGEGDPIPTPNPPPLPPPPVEPPADQPGFITIIDNYGNPVVLQIGTQITYELENGNDVCYRVTAGGLSECGGGGSGGDGGGNNACATTAATNLVTTNISSTQMRLDWSPGSGGVSQSIYVGTDKAAVAAGCPGGIGGATGCVAAVTGLPASLTTYTTNNVLSPGTVYYWGVVTYKSGCPSQASIFDISSCSLNSANVTIVMGTTLPLSSNVNSSTEISSVSYSPSGPFISLNPQSDNVFPYSTAVTGEAPGNGSITTTVSNTSGQTICSSSSFITVIPPSPWWQVKDSDIQTNGNIDSKVPFDQFFGLAGNGGYPGVPAAAGFASFGDGTVSETGWVAQSPWFPSKVFDYGFFNGAIPSDTVINILSSPSIDNSTFDAGAPSSFGYTWYRYAGDTPLSIDGDVALGSKRVVLFVDAPGLLINAPVNLTKGQGFFFAIVKGNINVDYNVGGSAYDLEGIYLADGTFSTGSSGTVDETLSVRGSVAAYGGINLEREIDGVLSVTTPSEFFEYAPDQILLFPSILGNRKTNWKEVAP